VDLYWPGVAPVARREGEKHGPLAGLVADLIPLTERALDFGQLALGDLASTDARPGRPGTRRARRGGGREVARAEPSHPALHRGVGLGLQVLPHQSRVHAGELERSHAIARSHQRLDEAERRAGANRLRRGETAPPPGGGGMVPSRGRGPGESLQHGGVLPGVAEPLGVLPALELGRVLQPESVEEGAPVEPCRSLVSTLLHRLLEFGDVAGDQLGIELERGAAQEHLVAAERPPDGVERLVERVARGLRVAVRPEERQEPLAAGSAAAGRGDHGEQREPAPLGGRPGVQLPVLLEDESAERIEAQHG
jgi:hypothetical protein